MFEPLKYGFPFGLLGFGLFIIQARLELNDFTIVRWIISTGLTVVATHLLYKRKSVNRFEFRVAWFVGFNVLIASMFTFVLLWFAVGAQFWVGDHILTQNEKLYVAAVEFGGMMTLGLVLLTISSAIFGKLK